MDIAAKDMDYLSITAYTTALIISMIAVTVLVMRVLIWLPKLKDQANEWRKMQRLRLKSRILFGLNVFISILIFGILSRLFVGQHTAELYLGALKQRKIGRANV